MPGTMLGDNSAKEEDLSQARARQELPDTEAQYSGTHVIFNMQHKRSNSEPAISVQPRLEPKPQRATKKHKHKRMRKVTGRRYLKTKKRGMMMGIRHTTGRQFTAADWRGGMAVDHEPTKYDFRHRNKLVFPPGGSLATPPHQLPATFKFKDYAPRVFKQLRHFYGADDVDYMLSLCGDLNYIEFISNSKSGQFFFYSNDRHFMIKTMSKAECKFVMKILPQYHAYMKNNHDSLINRYYGMHRVKVPHIRRKMRFIIMNNVHPPFELRLPGALSNGLHAIYDLKGSTVGRSAKAGEDIKKDLDLLRDEVQLRLTPPVRDAFLRQVSRDANFLHSFGVMDYSLLLGFRHEPSPEKREELLEAAEAEVEAERADGVVEEQHAHAVAGTTKGASNTRSPALHTKNWHAVPPAVTTPATQHQKNAQLPLASSRTPIQTQTCRGCIAQSETTCST